MPGGSRFYCNPAGFDRYLGRQSSLFANWHCWLADNSRELPEPIQADMSCPILPYDGDATALTDTASPMTGQQTEARPKPEVYKGRFKQETGK